MQIRHQSSWKLMNQSWQMKSKIPLNLYLATLISENFSTSTSRTTTTVGVQYVQRAPSPKEVSISLLGYSAWSSTAGQISVFTPIFLARRCLPTQIFDLLVAQTRSFPVLKFEKKLNFFQAEPYFLLLSTTLCPALIWGDTVDILISNSIYKPCSCRFLNHVSSFPHDTGTQMC